MINLQNKMAIKVTKKVKYAMALYHLQNKCHKECILHGNFHAFFKKCTTFGLCRPTTVHCRGGKLLQYAELNSNPLENFHG